MTTIAYDGYDLVADGLVNADGVITDRNAKKIHVINKEKEVYLAAAGSFADTLLVAEWMRGGMKPEDKPVARKGKKLEFEAILVGPNGVATISSDLVPIPGEKGDEIQAVGSGWRFALAAMHLGKTAKEAVELASKLDLQTGGRIRVQNIKPRKRKH